MAREETGFSPELGSPEGPPIQSLAWAFLGDEDASGPGFMEPLWPQPNWGGSGVSQGHKAPAW